MGNQELIKVVIKQPNQKPQVEMIKNDYETLHSLVNGFIQYCYDGIIAEGVAIVINEEGKLINLPLNFKIKDYSDYVVGNAIFIKTDYNTGESISLNDEDIKLIMEWIENQNSIKVNSFTRWLDTFIQEKGIDLNEFITFTSNKKDEVFDFIEIQIQYQNIIDWLKEANMEIQNTVKNEMVKLDFINKSITDYLLWIAKKIY